MFKKRIFNFGLWFLTLVVLVSCATLPKSTYQLREYKEVTLSNGLRVLLVPDKRLPYFTLSTTFLNGASVDPVSKSGLTNLTLSLLNKGTKAQTATQIADTFDQMGAKYSFDVDYDNASVSSSSLSNYREDLMKNYFEVLLTPSFTFSEFKRQKKLLISAIQSRTDNPRGFAAEMLNSYLFGSHPYGRQVQGSLLDVKSIRRLDIVNFYKNYVVPQNAILSVVGDYPSDIIPKLEEVTKNWKGSADSTQTLNVNYPKVEAPKSLEVRFVYKPDLKQTEIRFGGLGIKRSNPKYLELRLASLILGGSFYSRLMGEVRVKRGLTYSISSYFVPEKDRGSFLISTFTRHEKVGETVHVTLDTLKKFVKEGVTQEELDSAKALMKGNFPQALETAESLANNLLLLRIYGISDDYLKDFYKSVDNISLKDVNLAIRQYFHPNELKLLVYSDKSTLPQVRDLGPIEVKDYTEYLQH